MEGGSSSLMSMVMKVLVPDGGTLMRGECRFNRERKICYFICSYYTRRIVFSPKD